MIFAKPELYIHSPEEIPRVQTIRSVVQACFAITDEQAKALTETYSEQAWRTVGSVLPEGLDTHVGLLKAVTKATAFIRNNLEFQRNHLEVGWMQSPELVVASYCAEDPMRTSGVWRGVGLWATPAIILSNSRQ